MFFVASRGHHADIGGISPGSMPPHSKELYQEGAAIKSFKIVSKGQFDQKGLEEHLCTIPASYPGCSGSRAFRDNISGKIFCVSLDYHAGSNNKRKKI